MHGFSAAGGLARADVDLWLVGPLSPEAAADKIAHIGAVVRANAARRGGREVVAVRTKNTVTFLSAYPFRPIQVVLSVFQSPLQLLLDFDLDCASICWTGERLLAPPRALRAMSRRLNILRADVAPSRGTLRAIK